MFGVEEARIAALHWHEEPVTPLTRSFDPEDEFTKSLAGYGARHLCIDAPAWCQWTKQLWLFVVMEIDGEAIVRRAWSGAKQDKGFSIYRLPVPTKSINIRQSTEILTPCGCRGFFTGENTIQLACTVSGFKWWVVPLPHDMRKRPGGVRPMTSCKWFSVACCLSIIVVPFSACKTALNGQSPIPFSTVLVGQ
jgi:hypothetical protein